MFPEILASIGILSDNREIFLTKAKSLALSRLLKLGLWQKQLRSKLKRLSLKFSYELPICDVENCRLESSCNIYFHSCQIKGCLDEIALSKKVAILFTLSYFSFLCTFEYLVGTNKAFLYPKRYNLNVCLDECLKEVIFGTALPISIIFSLTTVD